MRTALFGTLIAALAIAAASPLAQQPAPVPPPATPDDKKGDEAAKEPKWDVTAPFGPTSTVSFDTNEGTWMNVDVSPDGARVVFDLLGDLYVMPIAGSTAAAPATRLTSGPAFDMQPRFSPDGKRIAFTSDRGGLFNIWVMDADGRNPSAVSREEKWWVNSPTWAPDGDYIFARKHLVSTRSLGAGEVWMYHRSGADGVQVTEKVSFQKDAGEPALSPDGKFLYFSKDVTPSPTFEYDKNPHAGIYAIVRRELATGRERTLVSGPAARSRRASRPTASGWPSSAASRRAVSCSCAASRPAPSGRSSRTWTRTSRRPGRSSGPTPSTPGCRTARASWCGAKAGSGGSTAGAWRAAAGREIPFVAKVEQTITEAIRFPVVVAPDRFPVRMLRGAVVAPDGTRVVYSALGKLWVRPLPAGTPKRLTARDDLEYAPAFSADGRTSSTSRGATSIAGASASSAPTAAAGARWSRRLATTSNRRSRRTASASSIAPSRATRCAGPRTASSPASSSCRRRAARPRSCARRARIRASTRPARASTSRSAAPTHVLASVTTANATRSSTPQSENALELVPSPDGRWIAFEERWRTYVAALPHSGRPIDIGPTTKAFPVAQVSRDSGWGLHWSDDSRRIHWTLGADLYTRDLPRRSRSPATAPRSRTSPKRRASRSASSSQRRAGRDDRAGRRPHRADERAAAGRGVIERGTVLVERNRIVAIGPEASVHVPAGARASTSRGKTIIPGLVDVHAHVRGESTASSRDDLAARRQPGLRRDHRARSVERHADGVHQERDAARRHDARAAALLDRHDPLRRRDAGQSGRRELRRRTRRTCAGMKAAGAFSVKSYNQQRRDARQMILKAARELGMMVVPEGGSLFYQNHDAIRWPHRRRALAARGTLYRDVVQLFAKTRVGYTPTLIVGYGGLLGENYWYQHDDVWENERLLTLHAARRH